MSLPKLHARLSKLWLYAVSTMSMMVGVAAQSVAFLIVARHLGKANYGQLTTLTALISVCSSWVQFGTAEMLRRRFAMDNRQYPEILGHCMIILFFFGSLATVIVSGALTFVVHLSDSRLGDCVVIWLFAFSTLVLFPWMVLVEQVFLAREMFWRANLTNAGFGAWRAVVAAIACISFGVETVSDWAVWNFAAYALASLAGAAAAAKFGSPALRLFKEELSIGATFGVSGFLANLRGNVDILSLSSIAPPELVGVYGLARKVVGVAVVTSASLDRLIYSRLVHASQQGLHRVLSAIIKFAGYALVITGATAIALYVVSPYLIPKVFGASFADAAPLVRLLCGLTVVFAMQNLAFDALNSANRHKIQVAITSVWAIVGATLVAVLTRKFAITGAISGLYIMETLVAIALWAGLGILSHPDHLPKLSILRSRIRPASRG